MTYWITLLALFITVLLSANHCERHGIPPMMSHAKWRWNCRGNRERVKA